MQSYIIRPGYQQIERRSSVSVQNMHPLLNLHQRRGLNCVYRQGHLLCVSMLTLFVPEDM